jgi:tetratricopeptide (TPR) repeat protein
MIVVGTKSNHFNAPWVKNEWSRYLNLVNKSQGEKILIPAYKDMDPYDLPAEFSHLQAQDMNKIGFMQDLVRGVKKIINPNELQFALANEHADANTNAIVPLLKRVALFLEDGDYDRADDFCEQILNRDPENADAYIYKLLIEFKCHNKEELSQLNVSLKNNKNYIKAVRFGNESQIKFLEETEKVIKEKSSFNRDLPKTDFSTPKTKEKAKGKTIHPFNLSDRMYKDLDDTHSEFEDYIDVHCPNCSETLSFMVDVFEENSRVVCPMCDYAFEIKMSGEK